MGLISQRISCETQHQHQTNMFTQFHITASYRFQYGHQRHYNAVKAPRYFHFVINHTSKLSSIWWLKQTIRILDSISCYYFNFRQELGFPHLKGSSQPVLPEHSNGWDSRKLPNFLTQTRFPASNQISASQGWTAKLPNTTFFQANRCANLSATEMGERILYWSVAQPLDSFKHALGHKPTANTKSSILGQICFTVIDLQSDAAIS